MQPDHAASRAGNVGPPAYRLLAACFLISGFAALVYQTAWMREFSLVFGTSELAVATVLAAYMGGLTAGALVAARFVDSVTRPVRLYGFLEAGIAVSALAVPLLLRAAGVTYAGLLGGRPELPDAWTFGQPLFYLLVAFVVLAIPTGLMGATLPLLTRHVVRTDSETGPRVGALYAINTFGAVLGALAAGFVLLPRFGLTVTALIAVGGNIAVFLIAVRLARTAPDMPYGSAGQDETSVVAATAKGSPILPLMLVSGATAFLYEVLYTRLLSHVLGSSVYAFATMLAAFLTGIAIGGAVGGAIARSVSRAVTAFVAAQLATGVLAAVGYASMQLLVPEGRSPHVLALYAVAVMLPSTFAIGATFPLAVRILTGPGRDAPTSAGRLYGWNTAGAIAGSILAAFWIIPALGFGDSFRLAIGVNCALALAGSLLLPSSTRRWAPVAALGLLTAVVLYQPGRPTRIITNSAFALPDERAGLERYFAVGRSATVLMTDAGGFFELRTNGLPEASILPVGAAPVGQTQQWLTALPLIARPDARSLLFVGFGGGVALEDLPNSIESIDVIELEPEVIEANRRIAESRFSDPLGDPRVNVVINDARNALRLSAKRFDAIVSQPSHPWTAGASHLFTQEFFALAREHLNADGVFVQWMSSGFVDAALLRSLTATLDDVFVNVRLYQPAPTVLMFVASDGPLEPEVQLAATGRPISGDPVYYGNMRLGSVSDLVAALTLDQSGASRFAESAELSTDDGNRMATDSRALADGLTADELNALLAPYDPVTDVAGGLPTSSLARTIDWIYVAQRMVTDGQVERARRLGGIVPDESVAAVIRGLVAGARGLERDAGEAFAAALAADPDNDTARYVLIQPRLAALAAGVADAGTVELAGGLSGSARAVVDGWRLAFEEDWPALAALDRALAQANPVDIWFPEVARLRADWRLRVAGDGALEAAATATRIVDRALAIQPSLDLLVLRAAAAERMADTAQFVESVRYAMNLVRRELDSIGPSAAPTRTELDTMFRRLRAMRARLAALDVQDERVRALSDAIGDQMGRIQVLLR